MGQFAAGETRRAASGPEAAASRLLICLDLQQASLSGSDGGDCVINGRRVLAHAREAGWGVVHVHARNADSEGGRPIAGLQPLASEPLMYRSGVSAFSSRIFRWLVKGTVCELVIIGYSMSSSCLATALVAYDYGLRVTLVEDAVAASPVEAHAHAALEAISRQIARPFVNLTSTADLLGQTRLLRAV